MPTSIYDYSSSSSENLYRNKSSSYIQSPSALHYKPSSNSKERLYVREKEGIYAGVLSNSSSNLIYKRGSARKKLRDNRKYFISKYYKILSEECKTFEEFLKYSESSNPFNPHDLNYSKEASVNIEDANKASYTKTLLKPYPHLEHVAHEKYLKAFITKPFDFFDYFSPDKQVDARGCLYPGAIFQGIQQSNNREYKVSVMMQHMNFDDCLVTGYLNIQNLVATYPSLTTFFEGEIIGPKVSFITSKWKCTPEIDFEHWELFPEFKPFKDDVISGIQTMPNIDSRGSPFLFMRWKEHFLVPDHTIGSVDGASYDGFYYICLNVIEGIITGYYFHETSKDWYELLSLKNIPYRNFDTYRFQ